MAFFFIALGMGIIGPILPLLNGSIIKQIGLFGLGFFNAIIGFLGTLCFYLIYRFYPHYFPSDHLELGYTVKWWHFISPLVGLLPMLLIPFAVKELGAFSAGSIMLVGNILTCFIYDAWVDIHQITLMRVAGLILVTVGGYLSCLT